jgi:aspartyl-tRNA(Asn)/glutamyl-tRNA(Gln) amidotransferase subunit B
VSDVRLEEGSMRFDANISVAPPGERGAKVEVKNLNSLKSLYRALAHEEVRQREVLSAGGTIDQSTRHWDERSGVTRPLRTKEHAFDYRYFPEPDLVPIKPSPEWLEAITSGIPELPPARRRRFVAGYGLTPYDASVLVASKAAADYFENAAAAGDVEPKLVANWLANDLLGRLSERGEGLETTRVTPQELAALVSLVAGGSISGGQGKVVLDEMVASGRPAAEIVEEKGLRQVSGRSELEAVVAGVLAANADVVERIRGGDTKPQGFLVGQIMKATKGQANPAVVQQLLKEKLQG